MGIRSVRYSVAFALMLAGLGWGPRWASAQEGHGSGGDAGEHAAGTVHGKNEIAAFVGATQRLGYADDEAGLTLGVDYVRRLTDRTAAWVGFEWADGDVERDWLAVVNVGVQPLNGWARPLTFSVGAGIEVAEESEAFSDGESGDGTHGAMEESGGSGEETEVDALMRLGLAWPLPVGRLQVIPRVSFDTVGEDWSIVGGISIGYAF